MRPLPYIRPKIERDLDDVIELIDEVSEERRVSENKETIRATIAAIKAIEMPKAYQSEMAGIKTALTKALRHAAKHEGIKTATEKVSVDLNAIVAALEKRRKQQRREEEEFIIWLLSSTNSPLTLLG